MDTDLTKSAASMAKFARTAAAMNVGEWLAVERRDYAEGKWADTNDGRGPVAALNSTPFEWIDMYLHRAGVLTLESPAGRQALGKAIVTATQLLEAAVVEHGPMPEPAHPSGELIEWVR